jgi:FtsZ-interacting cell division protein ZipA
MEDQVPSSTPPQMNQPIPGQITPEMLEGMKQQAREMAVAQYMAQQQRPQEKVEYQPNPSTAAPRPPLEPQRVVYVRRNLTVAELIVVFVLATGLVAGIQTGWRFASENLPRIQIQVK